MSYTLIQEKIDQGKIILLDGGIGAELEKKGAKMDQNLWCGKCSVDSPEFLKEVHENYIDAGADVIRQMLRENPSSYLGFQQSTYDECEFLSEIAKCTGCGLIASPMRC